MKKFDITQGIAYYIGSNIQTDKHSHHALEFIFGLEKPFDFYTSDAEFKNIYGVLVAPDVVHQFVGTSSEYLFLFLEPELLQTKEIMDFYQLQSFRTKELSSLTCKVNTNEILNFSFFYENLKIPISITPKKNISDERINLITDFIYNNLEIGQLKSKILASQIHLSESRFLHLFKEQLFLPLRKYILWCRIQKALIQIMKGNNFTSSAHSAGFSDSAHFSRTFFEMFGVSPSALFKR